MDFSLTEEQVLLRDSVEKYVRDHCSLQRHRSLIDTELGFDAHRWSEFAELGWLSMPFSEELGGFGGAAVDLMVMTEAMARGLFREPFLTTAVTCGGLLQCAGDNVQRDQYSAGIMSGESQWAFAFAELGSGYDFDAVETVAEEHASGHYLTGKKLAVLNGHCANYFIVTAKTAAGVSLFIVPNDSAGIKLEVFTALDGSHGAHVSFENVHAECLGTCGHAQDYLDRALATTIVAMGGEAVGAMQVLLDATVEYTKTREQFGQAIGKFQILQHAMADMYLKVEETRSLLLHAAILLDDDSDGALKACAALKVKISEAGRFVAKQAIQLHGGIGMTDELNIGHHFKRLLLLGMLYGDADYYLQRYMDQVA